MGLREARGHRSDSEDDRSHAREEDRDDGDVRPDVQKGHDCSSSGGRRVTDPAMLDGADRVMQRATALVVGSGKPWGYS